MKKISIKNHISNFAKKRYYFHLQDLQKYFKKNNVEYNEENLKKSILRLKRNNIIYGAGRGWYSTIVEKFVLHSEPIEKIIKIISEKFPLLEFSCWGTEQLKSFFHHLPTQFLTFIYLDKDYLPTLKDFLWENNYNVFLNPSKKETEKFLMIRNKTIILRSAIHYRKSKNQYLAKIEKIIVDLFMEMKKVNLIDFEEYKKIVSNIILSNRVNIAEILDYAHSRKIRDEIYIVLQEICVSTKATLF